MSYATLHPDWERAAPVITDGYSLEMTVKDRAALNAAAPLIAPATPIAVTFLPGENMDQRVATAVHIRELGFEPMPHLSARRIGSEGELATMVERIAREAGVRRCFLVAGDPAEAAGPYADTLQMIASGIFEANGITAIGIAGHPEGHPQVNAEDLWRWMEQKTGQILHRGMVPLVVTQFGFDPDAFLHWLAEMRRRGFDAPVRIGVPGPAGIRRLLRYASACGVGASAAVLRKYGISLGNLIGSAGPDRLVTALAAGLGPEHGRVRLHFYPFGGLEKTVEWIDGYTRRHAPG